MEMNDNVIALFGAEATHSVQCLSASRPMLSFSANVVPLRPRVRELVDEFGGCEAVAREWEGSIPASAVARWVEDNVVPQWRRRDFKRLAKRHGIKLCDHDLASAADLAREVEFARLD
jgi:hypothetical protein